MANSITQTKEPINSISVRNAERLYNNLSESDKKLIEKMLIDKILIEEITNTVFALLRNVQKMQNSSHNAAV